MQRAQGTMEVPYEYIRSAPSVSENAELFGNFWRLVQPSELQQREPK